MSVCCVLRMMLTSVSKYTLFGGSSQIAQTLYQARHIVILLTLGLEDSHHSCHHCSPSLHCYTPSALDSKCSDESASCRVGHASPSSSCGPRFGLGFIVPKIIFFCLMMIAELVRSYCSITLSEPSIDLCHNTSIRANCLVT